MNALVSIETLTPATVFVPGGVEGIISKLETDIRAIERDISTPDGRELIRSTAYKIARSKTALDDMGKDLVSDIKAKAALIDADRRTIRERLDALKDDFRKPLTEWEEAEKARVAGHEAALVFLIESVRFDTPPSVTELRERIGTVSEFAGRYWQEFKERGDAAICEALARLREMKERAKQAEKDAAELAELRRMKAERDEADRIAEARRAAEERAAAEAAKREQEERAKREWMEKQRAEAAARMDRHLAELAEREAQRAEQAERDRAAAVAWAIEQERRRAAQEKAAEEKAATRREANKRHRHKIESAVVDALTSIEGGNINKTDADLILAAIVAGRIPNVSINY